jgi:hypothetical protein
MICSRVCAIILMLMVLEVGCATPPPPYEPFKTSREELFAKVKTIALAPVRIPADIEDQEPVRKKFESLIEAKLREAGFVVIPSSEYEALWKRTTEQMGGVYDPMTGKPDEAKTKAVITHTLRELQRTANAEAVLYSRVQPVVARFFNGMAKWDGTSESVTGAAATSTLARFLLIGPQAGTSGTVSALSLVAIINDINDVMMYANGGGIQLTARLSGHSFTPVPRKELFSTEEHYIKPVNLALDSLLKTEQASPAGQVKAKAQ